MSDEKAREENDAVEAARLELESALDDAEAEIKSQKDGAPKKLADKMIEDGAWTDNPDDEDVKTDGAKSGRIQTDKPNKAQGPSNAETAEPDEQPLTEPKEIDRQESPCGCIVVTYDDESQRSQPCLACSYKSISELFSHISGMHAMAWAHLKAQAEKRIVVPQGRPHR